MSERVFAFIGHVRVKADLAQQNCVYSFKETKKVWRIF